ncbi:MAG: 16S rRNA (cytosine(1402)-N(4))-methyltransferase RsmH [Microbacteriaceae bacterium]
MSIAQLHQPVLLERCIELLAPAIEGKSAVLVDCTLGLGGHAEAFLERFPELTVVGLDRDPKALKLAGERLSRFGTRAIFCHVVYDQIGEALEDLGIAEVDGILMDLGVSSMQLDEQERGFAYSYEAPLDMRMDNSTGITAAEIVNEYSEEELARIFKEFGEERFSRQIARAIVSERNKAPFATSTQLAALIAKIVPFIPGKSSGHPAKRVFQALRIEVNGELEVLERTMPQVIDALAVGGRVVVLSYQSLEDRIVKRAFASASTSSAPLDLPIELPEHAPVLKLVVKGAELASEDEKSINPRSASVRLRAAEKIRQAA